MARISISQDGVWAGDGVLVRDGSRTYIEDCPAVLGPDHLDHESGEQQDHSEDVYLAIEEAIERGETSLEMDGIAYAWEIREPEIEVVGLGDEDWTDEHEDEHANDPTWYREWHRYGAVLVRIDGVEYQVGASIGVPKHLVGTVEAAGGDKTRPAYLAAWYEDQSDYTCARRTDTGESVGIPAGLSDAVIGAISEAVVRLWGEHEAQV